ncbi:MAG: hypothetical protein Q4G16_04450 [Cruoricaptor ignavus]|nr:hypothetical protein [Cruoricaptor ignavus]
MKMYLLAMVFCMNWGMISAQTNERKISDSVIINEKYQIPINIEDSMKIKESIAFKDITISKNLQNKSFIHRERSTEFNNLGKQNNAVNPKDYMIRGALNYVPKIKIKLK